MLTLHSLLNKGDRYRCVSSWLKHRLESEFSPKNGTEISWYHWLHVIANVESCWMEQRVGENLFHRDRDGRDGGVDSNHKVLELLVVAHGKDGMNGL